MSAHPSGFPFPSFILPRADFYYQPDTEERAKAAKAAKANEGYLKKAGGVMRRLLSGTPAKPKGYPSPWDLPEVNDEEVEAEVEFQRGNGEKAAARRGSKKPASPRKPSSPTKKPSSPRKPSSPQKIPRRESEDEDAGTDDDGDFVMSGGLY